MGKLVAEAALPSKIAHGLTSRHRLAATAVKELNTPVAATRAAYRMWTGKLTLTSLELSDDQLAMHYFQMSGSVADIWR